MRMHMLTEKALKPLGGGHPFLSVCAEADQLAVCTHAQTHANADADADAFTNRYRHAYTHVYTVVRAR